MKDELVKAIFVEYFSSNELLYYIQNLLPLPFLQVSGKKVPTGIEPARLVERLVEFVNNKANGLRLDRSRFKRLLRTHVNALVSGRKPTKSLENLISSHCEYIKSEIRGIPNTLGKARDALLALIEVGDFVNMDQVYDAMVLISDKVTSELIAEVVGDWKEKAKRYDQERRGRGAPFATNDIFWVSRDFTENLDGVSRYRFREHFDVGEFEPAFREVEAMLAHSLLEGSTGMEAIGVSHWGDTMLTSVAYDLWLVSRSRKLTNRIRDFVDIALLRIARWQDPEGWWTDFQLLEPAVKDPEGRSEKPRRLLPSTYTTALCSLDLRFFRIKCGNENCRNISR